MNGFVFEAPTGDDILTAIGRCVATYAHQPAQWHALRERAMRGDYSWEQPALEYLRLYGAAPATASAGG